MSSYGWLEIELERTGADLAIRGRGGRDERPEAYTLGADLSADLEPFAERVRAAAAAGKPLGLDLARARALYRALLRGELEVVLARLREASEGRPVLLRLLLRDTGLQALPWEALCEPGTDFGFLGNSPTLLPVRGVSSREPRQPRDVAGAVRVLAIAPLHESALSRLQGALHESLATGEVEWLEPLTGDRARKAPLFERLRRAPVPHIIHFIGHGGMEDGRPVLRLADEDGEESWVPVELLAQQLGQTCGTSSLRLVVLEACEGASPGNQASAAELLARTGADAVVAHLWPVRADVARRCSGAFYRALTREAQQRGDVALSLNEARRSVLAELGGSAEAFSPVLYLRGSDSVLFDFRRRSVSPSPQAAVRTGAAAPAPALGRLLERPFTLLLGDRWEDEHPVLHGLRERLREELARKMGAEPPELPLSTLAEHFALHIGEEELGYEFQEVFGRVDFTPPLAGALARRLGPGVHVTLLRLPVLEHALAEHQPGLTIDVLQPPLKVGGHITVFRREAGDSRWERLREAPATLDPEREVVVLRLCSGYLPPHFFSRPVLTEDDYLRGVRGLDSLLPPDLADSLQGVLSLRPALLLGLSVLHWNHRMLLHQLFGTTKSLPRHSLVVLAPGTRERELWESGKGLPGAGGVQVVEAGDEDFLAQLEALAAREAA